MSRIIDELKRTDHKRYLGGLDFFKYIGPGLLVTVGLLIRETGPRILRPVPNLVTRCCGW